MIWDPHTNNRYVKAEFLGSGGFGACYKVIKVCPEKTEFACKILMKSKLTSESRLDSLRDEITLQRSLSHPNIVRQESFFEDDEHVYILMELCPYLTLYELLKRRKSLSEFESIYFLRQLADGLQAMH